MMTWSRFRDNEKRIRLIANHVQISEPANLPGTHDMQMQTLTQYLKTVIYAQNAEINEAKADFHEAALHGEVKSLESALPIERSGQEILNTQKIVVKKLAKNQAKLKTKRDKEEKIYQKKGKAIGSCLSKMEENWTNVIRVNADAH